ncbi:immunoglobulin-like domain-containing protein [Maledivibacter halophilus]|uniref:Bacterial Ig-like domain-containing protein n=1 Tax=Maledivibacter halophilus TaxID=36842 RepID=A0A1T5M145_9FIRM|nr:immunoglobulin-like domain-containing protein [Maledivibacter halophilus]SKC81970.1 hypothetical protein SAMN02194393_03688 [Maledivibacter halophilus]
MKKYLHLSVCMAISLALLVGCGNNSNSNLAEGTEDTVTETVSNQPTETTDWEPTTYETVNNFDGVTMTLKEGTVSSSGLTLAIENNSNSQCIYGEYFWLEKKINGSWYQVPVAIDGNYGFNDIGYDLASGDDGEWAVDWEWLYGSLDTGEYRIVKDIQDFRGSGEYDNYYLVVEFIIC